MILFDVDIKRAKKLRRLIRKQCTAAVAIYDNDSLCANVLSETDTETLWIGTYSDYLINWIVSMQPFIRTIVVYDEHNKDDVLMRLKGAQYKTSFIEYNLLIERLT